MPIPRPPKPFLARSALPLLIAHRGGAAERPESTLEAFRHALEDCGADILELDVWFAADEAVVVFHDSRVDRTTNATGALRDLSLEQLREIDSAHLFERPGIPGVFPYRGKEGMGIVTLEEVLRTFPSARINIDLKEMDFALTEAALKIVDDCGAWNRVCVGSFNDELMLDLTRWAPKELCLSAPSRVVADIVYLAQRGRIKEARIERWGFDVMQIPASFGGLLLVTQKLMDAYHAAGWSVHVWTIDDEKQMHELAAMNVDGIVTDHPTRFRRVLDDFVLGG